MKKILILGASELQIPLIEKCCNYGLFTIVLDRDSNAPGAQSADLFLPISTVDLEAIYNLVQEENISAIITTSEFPVQIVSKVALLCGLISASLRVAELCTNKYLQRAFLADTGFKVPRFKLIENIQECIDFSERPFVLKPVDSSGSRGVKLISSINDISWWYGQSKLFSSSGLLIAEEFIGGREFSVETLSQHGITYIIAITEKRLFGGSREYFVESCHVLPAELSAEEYKCIEKAVNDVTKRMGFDNCGGHIELKLIDNDVYFVEIACRLGGDFISSDLVPLATGVDMMKNLIKISLGDPIDIEHSVECYAAIQFISNLNYDRCISELACKNPLIIKSEVKEFQNIEPRNSLDRLGHIIVKSETRKELEDFLDKLN